MAKTEGDPVLDSEQEEIALSDSELDNVLKSAEITSEASVGDDEDNLEQYGVWVKVEPQDVEQEAERNMSFELSDLEGSSESALTEEEEQLLGELEADEETDLGDLSGLEDDLEELGKGSAFEEESGEEELSVEDLDVDLDELGEESLSVPDMEALPDLEGEEELGPGMEAETEIEVPLSDSAIVEEHYEDLATVEGVPSTPGKAPPKASSDILEKIERDLNQIKAEIQGLKSELAGLGKGGLSAGKKVAVAPTPSGAEGFFEKGEDETIALTGDELDNILNTADVTEEVSEGSVESLDMEEIPEQALPGDMAEQLEGQVESEGEIMDLGSLDLEEEGLSEEISLEDSEQSLAELEPSTDEEQSIEIDIGGTTAEEELSLDEELETLEGEIEEIEDLSLQEPEEESALEELEGLDLEEAAVEEAEGAEELDLEEPAEELDLEELDELGLEEAGLEEAEGAEELSLEEPAEELDLEELDELGLEEAGLEEAEGLEELSLEEPAGSAEEQTASEELEELSLEEPGLEEVEAPEGLTLEEMPAEAVQEAADREPAGFQPDSGVLSDDLRSEIKSVLSYFDQLLEALPEDKIKEFAQSEYFVRYKRLFEELGLGA